MSFPILESLVFIRSCNCEHKTPLSNLSTIKKYSLLLHYNFPYEPTSSVRKLRSEANSKAKRKASFIVLKYQNKLTSPPHQFIF